MPHCCYGNCNSDSRMGRPGYDPSTKFYSFPKPCFAMRDSVENWNKTLEKQHLKACKKCQLCWEWMIKCKRDDYKFQSALQVATNTFICSRHFEDVPVVMDYNKYRPLASITPSESRKRRQNLQLKRMASEEVTGSEVGSPRQGAFGIVDITSRPIPQGESSSGTVDRNDAFTDVGGDEMESIIVPSSSVIEDRCCSDIIFDYNNYQVMTAGDIVVVADQERKVMVQSKDASTQTTWVFRDRSILTNQIELMSKKINDLEKEITRLLKKHDAISLEAFEKKLSEDDKMCKFYTGMDNNQLAALKLFCQGDTIVYWGNETSQVSDENGEHSSKKPSRQRERKLTQNEELLLFFFRFRGGFLIQDIAYKFGLAPTTISRIVTTYVKYLYDKFSCLRLSMFPTRDVIKQNLPSRFRKFKNIRVIIDCAEIFCEKPANFEQQGNMYSNYKAHTTVKFLIGCTPNGAVSFVGDVFEGSISDKQIVEKSGLIELLEEGDMILADRGFTIKDLTDEKGVNLKIPAFLRERDALTPQEELETKEIAANRIFIEHVVGRLKNFRFFQRVVPLNMRSVLSQAVFVCACLLNFQDPLVK